MNKRQQAGFTLLELMIVVVVGAIIATVGFSSYLQQMQKSRRTDARVALETLAQKQGQFFSQYRTYTGVVEAPGGCADAACGLNQSTATSNNNYYTITATGNGTAYALTATAINSQLDDTECRTLTLNSAGVRAAANSSGTDTTDVCW